MAKKNTPNTPKARNFHQVMAVRGEINLQTRSESIGKKKHTRKVKHKAQRIDY